MTKKGMKVRGLEWVVLGFELNLGRTAGKVHGPATTSEEGMHCTRQNVSM